ncbi:hypothetical protein QQP08_022240 [Theobroma cacao]|nr:hypothetical protein QQP08_022240 [Theobroma cacao]
MGSNFKILTVGLLGKGTVEQEPGQHLLASWRLSSWKVSTMVHLVHTKLPLSTTSPASQDHFWPLHHFPPAFRLCLHCSIHKPILSILQHPPSQFQHIFCNERIIQEYVMRLDVAMDDLYAAFFMQKKMREIAAKEKKLKTAELDPVKWQLHRSSHEGKIAYIQTHLQSLKGKSANCIDLNAKRSSSMVDPSGLQSCGKPWWTCAIRPPIDRFAYAVITARAISKSSCTVYKPGADVPWPKPPGRPASTATGVPWIRIEADISPPGNFPLPKLMKDCHQHPILESAFGPPQLSAFRVFEHKTGAGELNL